MVCHKTLFQDIYFRFVRSSSPILHSKGSVSGTGIWAQALTTRSGTSQHSNASSDAPHGAGENRICWFAELLNPCRPRSAMMLDPGFLTLEVLLSMLLDRCQWQKTPHVQRI